MEIEQFIHLYMVLQVIPDSLTTLSQYLSHISHEFDTIGEHTMLNFIVILSWLLLQTCFLRMMEHILLAVREGGNNAQAAEAHRNEETGSVSSRLGSTPESLSSPASLAEVLLSTRRMIVEQAGECILVCSKASPYIFILYMS